MAIHSDYRSSDEDKAYTNQLNGSSSRGHDRQTIVVIPEEDGERGRGHMFNNT